MGVDRPDRTYEALTCSNFSAGELVGEGISLPPGEMKPKGF